ncbi:MAG: hypothetical protein WCA21_01990 [Terracidiphilus sp.]
MNRMNRTVLVSALMIAAAAALGAQEASQSSPYQGVSTPPPDDTIITSSTPQATPQEKARPLNAVSAAPEENRNQEPAQAASVKAPSNPTDPDGDIVTVASTATDPSQPASQPVLTRRSANSDPDSDIVQVQPARPGELLDGATIRVELMGRLSTASSERDEAFRSRVASDVLQGGQVLIPAGAEIDGRVTSVSSGHLGGHGSMRLEPETLILPDGTRYRLQAEITGTPGARSRVGSEGTILPASRLKRDGIEYGGAVGAGATTGALLGGPLGAMTGGLVGAGVVTTHLLVDHPQATLNPGTVLIFTLSEPLQMAPAAGGN